MAVETAADIASMFDEDEFAEAAVYVSPTPGVLPVDCLVIMDRGQGRQRFRAGEQSAATSERHLWVQAGDELNQLPDVKRDATFVTDAGETFKVVGLPKLDHEGHLWSVDLVIAD